MFKSELKNIYNVKQWNGMTCINENEVNKIAELNLLYDIINPSKRTKN